MAVFRDKHDRDWHVDIDVHSLRRVKTGGLGVDLLDITDESKNLAKRLFDEPELLVGVLYEVCRPEIETRGITAHEFGEAFNGEAIDSATSVLNESLVDFIPSHRGRAVAQAAVHGMTLVDKLGLNNLDEERERRGLQSITVPE